MTTEKSAPVFTGVFQANLKDLASLMNWLATEHGLSFVQSGDDKVFAYGGAGYVLVFDQSQWQGVIELFTPSGALTIRPDDSGTISVQAATQSEEEIKKLLADGVESLRAYYEEKYWNSPRVE